MARVSSGFRRVAISTARSRRRAAVTLITAALLALVTSAPAYAHAQLLSTNPANGSQLQTAPKSIELVWAERVDRATIRVLDERGQEIQGVTTSTPIIVGSRIVFTPARPLTLGSWAVSWHVTSVDGHLVDGAFAFSIGAPLNTGVLDAVTSNAWLWNRVLAGAGWLGVMVGLGALWARRRNVGMAAALVSIMAEAGVLTRVAGVTDSNPLLVGEGRAAAFVGIAAAVLLNGNARQRQTGNDVSTTSIMAVLWYAMQAVASGHQLDLTGWVAPITTIALAAHLAASLVWVSAVLALCMRVTAEQALRTRRLATAAIAVLLPAAILTAVPIALPLPATPTPWVASLAIKLGLVAIALGLGALNHRRIGRSTEPETMRAVRRFIVFEVAVMIAVVSATVGLTSFAAPAPTAAADLSAAQSGQGPIAKIVRFDNGLFGTFRHTPVPVGQPMPWEFTMSPMAGSAVQLSDLRVTAETQAVGPVTMTAVNDGTTWRGSALLPTRGFWTITITAYPDEFTEIVARTVVEMR